VLSSEQNRITADLLMHLLLILCRSVVVNPLSKFATLYFINATVFVSFKFFSKAEDSKCSKALEKLWQLSIFRSVTLFAYKLSNESFPVGISILTSLSFILSLFNSMSFAGNKEKEYKKLFNYDN